MKYSFLAGRNIYLRPLEPADRSFFLRWYNDAETRARIGAPTPTCEVEADALSRRSGQDCVWFAVVRRSDDKVVGETGLLRMFPAWQTTDLTIMIPDPQDQGKGYGSEAVYLMMDYAFGYLGYHRIAIGVVGFNHSALAFYQKMGFRQEGVQEQGYYYNYQYHDFIMMRILREEFLALQEKTGQEHG